MSDVVVTVPKSFRWDGSDERGLAAWIDEGDAAGDPYSGILWKFSTWGARPEIAPAERVYVVCEGRVRGFAPLVELRFSLVQNGLGRVVFVRGDGAEAVTIPHRTTGFRGWRYRWWHRDIEVAFPNWKTADREVRE